MLEAAIAQRVIATDPTDDPIPAALAVSLELRRRWERERDWLRQRADDIDAMLNGGAR